LRGQEASTRGSRKEDRNMIARGTQINLRRLLTTQNMEQVKGTGQAESSGATTTLRRRLAMRS